MVKLATQLSQNFPFMRVDLYLVEEQIIFGELTFYPASGFAFLKFPKRDKVLGNLFDLPKIT